MKYHIFLFIVLIILIPIVAFGYDSENMGSPLDGVPGDISTDTFMETVASIPGAIMDVIMGDDDDD